MLLGPSNIRRVGEKIKRERLISKSGHCFIIVSHHGPGTRLRRPVRGFPPRYWLRFGFAAVGVMYCSTDALPGTQNDQGAEHQCKSHPSYSCVTRVTVGIILESYRRHHSRDLPCNLLDQGGFTPLGLTLLQELARRGVHIIALSPEPISSPRVDIIIELLRSTTSNENIFAERCDLSSPASIREFCSRFLTAEENRLGGIVFAHGCLHVGSPLPKKSTPIEDEMERQTRFLATFLITTPLLPILVAPVL